MKNSSKNTTTIPVRHCTFALLCALLSLTAGNALAADPNLGRNLAATCANCHGPNGQSTSAAVEKLAGLSRGKIISSMRAFKRDQRPATIMHQIAKGYTQEQIELIAQYLSQQK